MAGKKAGANTYRKNKYKDRRDKDIASKNKEVKWKARVRKLERKGHKHKFPTLEAEQAASRAATERGKEKARKQHFEKKRKKEDA